MFMASFNLFFVICRYRSLIWIYQTTTHDALSNKKIAVE